MTRRASARRYARALFDVALAEGHDLEGIERELSGLAGVVSGNDQLERVFANPAIPAARKRAVVEALLSLNPLSPVVQRTVLLLADRDRLVLLPEVAEAYLARLMEHQNVVRAEVTTAMPLPPDSVTALRQELARATGREVLLDVTVDPSIIGGAIARIGSTVYDGSLATQLDKLRRQLAGAQA